MPIRRQSGFSQASVTLPSTFSQLPVRFRDLPDLPDLADLPDLPDLRVLLDLPYLRDLRDFAVAELARSTRRARLVAVRSPPSAVHRCVRRPASSPSLPSTDAPAVRRPPTRARRSTADAACVLLLCCANVSGGLRRGRPSAPALLPADPRRSKASGFALLAPCSGRRGRRPSERASTLATAARLGSK